MHSAEPLSEELPPKESLLMLWERKRPRTRAELAAQSAARRAEKARLLRQSNAEMGRRLRRMRSRTESGHHRSSGHSKLVAHRPAPSVSAAGAASSAASSQARGASSSDLLPTTVYAARYSGGDGAFRTSLLLQRYKAYDDIEGETEEFVGESRGRSVAAEARGVCAAHTHPQASGASTDS